MEKVIENLMLKTEKVAAISASGMCNNKNFK